MDTILVYIRYASGVVYGDIQIVLVVFPLL